LYPGGKGSKHEELRLTLVEVAVRTGVSGQKACVGVSSYESGGLIYQYKRESGEIVNFWCLGSLGGELVSKMVEGWKAESRT
jgi:hypothetical protein